MARFTSRDLMVSVLPEDSEIQLMAGPKGCVATTGTGCKTGCTNPSFKKHHAEAAGVAELDLLREQLTLAQL